MDITKLSIIELKALKALIYDEIIKLEIAQRNIKLLTEQLNKTQEEKA